MSTRSPPRLLELALQSLLKHEALAIAALEELPAELFPPLFMAAYKGRCSETLKAVVQAWPYACLPLGPLMKEQPPKWETFQAVLSGLDMLLVREVRPTRWKLQRLDLRKYANLNFWSEWSGTGESWYSFLEQETALPVNKQKPDGCGTGAKQSLVPVQVMVDLSLKQDEPDELLISLIDMVKQKKGLLHLCCNKMEIIAVPMQNIKATLKIVELDSVQFLEIFCTWNLPVLGSFALHVSQMINLRRLCLSHIYLPSSTYSEEEEHYVNQFASQFLTLCYLQELFLDSVSFLRGCLSKVLGCLSSPLQTLSLINCVLLESDLIHLSQCPNTTQLKNLALNDISLTYMSPEPLRLLLEQTSSTLQDLDLDKCGITDSQLTAILPSLTCCSKLTTFTFCGNFISMDVLQNLMIHTIKLDQLLHVLYPIPLESYDSIGHTFNMERLVHLHNKLKKMLCDLGKSDVVWFSSNPCPYCGDTVFYDPEPLQCSCYMPD
ncbi:melanoma antigen preferentially expressed in tumors-like [Ctenodactylus gundi]